ncbi:MAG: ATP-binding protein [Actinomycetota bacterium]|nr:ATP-binding protein [Actinomycetota bacterium]
MALPLPGDNPGVALSVQPAQVRIALPAVPESAARARRTLVQAGLGEDVEHTVTLLATELVTNAVRHATPDAGARLVLVAHLEPDFVRVEVHDAGPAFDPAVRHSAKGFGLRLIDSLSTRWGVERERGNRVWFELDRRSGRRFARNREPERARD